MNPYAIMIQKGNDGRFIGRVVNNKGTGLIHFLPNIPINPNKVYGVLEVEKPKTADQRFVRVLKMVELRPMNPREDVTTIQSAGFMQYNGKLEVNQGSEAFTDAPEPIGWVLIWNDRYKTWKPDGGLYSKNQIEKYQKYCLASEWNEINMRVFVGNNPDGKIIDGFPVSWW